METGRPSVGIVMTGQDTFGTIGESLASVLAHTPADVEIVVAVPPLPGIAARAVDELSAQRRFRLVAVPAWQPQNALRNAAIAGMAAKDFYVLLDADTVVAPEWLEKLLRHVRATGADLVSPLVLAGAEGKVVHMAGGRVVFRPDPDGRPGMDQHHDHSDTDLATVEASLPAAPFETQLVELHCLLISARAMAWIGSFDEHLEGCMEHVDVSQIVLRAGGRLAICPDVRTLFLDKKSHVVADLPYHVAAWNREASARKLRYFARKYGIAEDGDYVRYQLGWNARYFEGQGTIRRPGPAPKPLVDLAGHGYAQTWPQLACQLAALGWTAAEMAESKTCHAVAQVQYDGLYRASAKPFLAHLVGTASILAAYGAPPPLVQAGLLHAAYTEGRLAEAQQGYAPPAVRRWLAERVGETVERFVFDYGRQPWAELPPPRDRDALDRYPLDRARALLIKTANDIEERLDHAASLSAKTPAQGSAVRAHAEAVLDVLGFGAMLRDLLVAERLAAEAQGTLPDTLRDDGVGSYPIGRLAALRYVPPAPRSGWLKRFATLVGRAR